MKHHKQHLEYAKLPEDPNCQRYAKQSSNRIDNIGGRGKYGPALGAFVRSSRDFRPAIGAFTQFRAVHRRSSNRLLRALLQVVVAAEHLAVGGDCYMLKFAYLKTSRLSGCARPALPHLAP